MWLFYAEFGGHIPMGNDGQLKVPKSIRSRRALMKLAESWLGKRAGRIYLITTWTRQMSELGPWAFEDYIEEHGELLLKSQYTWTPCPENMIREK